MMDPIQDKDKGSSSSKKKPRELEAIRARKSGMNDPKLQHKKLGFEPTQFFFYGSLMDPQQLRKVLRLSILLFLNPVGKTFF